MSVFEVPTYVTTIPLPAPLTSGSGVQSYTDPNGDVWVAANGVRGGNWYRARDVVSARLTRAAALTTTANAVTAYPFDTNTGSYAWDAYGLTTIGAAAGFTCPVPGIYLASFMIHLQALGTASNRVYCYLAKTPGYSVITDDFSGGTVLNTSYALKGNTNFLAATGDKIQATYFTTVATACYVGLGDAYMTVQYLGTG